MTSGYMTVLFIFIGQIPIPEATIYKADPLFALMIIPDFYLPHVVVADQ